MIIICAGSGSGHHFAECCVNIDLQEPSLSEHIQRFNKESEGIEELCLLPVYCIHTT